MQEVDSGIDMSQPWIRLIPVLILKHGMIVRSQNFRTHQVIGNPMSTVARFSDWQVDELVILDISTNNFHDLRREDLFQSYGGSLASDVLGAIAQECQMPLTFGGGIKSLMDIDQRLELGADKISLNTAALENPELITQAANRFGQQCIVVSIDAIEVPGSGSKVAFRGNEQTMKFDPSWWAYRAQELGAGEILLNSIDRDGTGAGYDLCLSQSVSAKLSIPLVLLGGVGNYHDFAPGALTGKASALAAANIFHFQELSYVFAKDACLSAGLPVRRTEITATEQHRKPSYDQSIKLEKINLRKARAESSNPGPWHLLSSGENLPRVTWCARCVYPSNSAVPLEFNSEGICTGCQVSETKKTLSKPSWDRKETALRILIKNSQKRSTSGYDCIIAVSGGKDSYYQTHLLKTRYGLNPLLVTYDGNNWTDVGWENLLRMREAFNADHLIVRPSVSVLKKLNRLGFLVMGDMNWHAHVGIMTVPMAMAIRYQIPLVFYGEHGYLDLSGQFSLEDMPEVTYRDRLEHFARGYEWNYFVGLEDLTEKDLLTWRYPKDKEIYDLGLRGVFLGNYVPWDANIHINEMIDLYGFKTSDIEFDRTYRKMSNLDDMHENGVHDYLKYIKFGYGRATDHASKDIRAGLLSREEAIALVNHYDAVKPSDLQRWLDYVQMKEAEFDALADTYRDPRVWKFKEGSWLKQSIS